MDLPAGHGTLIHCIAQRIQRGEQVGRGLHQLVPKAGAGHGWVGAGAPRGLGMQHLGLS